MDDIIQGSPEWFALRCGKVTASRVADVIATTKSGPSASRQNYLAQLVAEILTGTTAESYTNAAMQHGVDTEPHARAAYEFYNDVSVVEVGFVVHPSITQSGASPDGLVGDEGLVEIKCPNTSTHIATLLDQKVPAKYITQMMWQMACTETAWCDFVSFDPRLPEDLQLFVRRVGRDNERISELENAVVKFLIDVDKTILALNKLRDA